MTHSAQLLRDLVAIPSINPMGRAVSGPQYYEHRVTAYLEEFFRGLGVPYERQVVAPLRENIVARFDPPHAKTTVMFEVHQDTVPVEGMTIDPFGAEIRDGRLYGRGACDIKGGMAAMLAAFAQLVREKPPGASAVVMACVVDEEFTFRGVLELARRRPLPDMAIVAEPTGLNIVNAHKGAVRWHLNTTGTACHSSRPHEGVNAIYRMGRVLVGLERYAEHLRRTTQDPLLGPASLSVGLIEGGVSVNTVPDRCRIEIDRRVINGEDPAKAPEDVLRFLREEGIEFPIQNDPPWTCKGALSPQRSEPVVARLGPAINAVMGSHQVMAVPYGTDASTLAAAGVPCVVFGPGDIAQAHTKDEWVSLEQVEQASEILYRFAVER